MIDLTHRQIGFCIYCGDKESKLSREHIVPYALSGKYTLTKASCEICRKKTQTFEDKILSGIFRDYRFFKGMRSYSKFKNFNPVRTYKVRTKDGEEEIRDLHLNQVGLHLFIPDFSEPKFLMHDESEGLNLRGFCHFNAKPKPQNIVSDLEAALISQTIPTNELVRLLCKIAHGYVYLEGKQENFESYVVNIILGESGKEDWKYVGSPAQSFFKKSESGIKLYQQRDYLLAEIKLFDDIEVTYLVVVGKIIK